MDEMNINESYNPDEILGYEDNAILIDIQEPTGRHIETRVDSIIGVLNKRTGKENEETYVVEQMVTIMGRMNPEVVTVSITELCKAIIIESLDSPDAISFVSEIISSCVPIIVKEIMKTAPSEFGGHEKRDIEKSLIHLLAIKAIKDIEGSEE